MGAISGLGGLGPRRPDQVSDPPPMVTAPGGAAGTFRGRLVVIFGTGKNMGLFVYSPTPGAGNLVASIAAAAGTDLYTNAYLPGVVSYSKFGPPVVAVQIASGLLSYYSATTQAGPWSGVIADIETDGVADMVMGANGVIRSATKVLLSVASVPVTNARLEVQSGQVAAEAAYVATADVANFPLAAPSGVETWHLITPQNSWADSGLGPNFQCRIVTSPPNSVEIIGDLTAGTLTNGTVIGALPSSHYFPASNQQLMLVWPGTPPTSPGAGRFFVSTAGNIEAEGLAGASGRCFVHGFISLDA